MGEDPDEYFPLRGTDGSDVRARMIPGALTGGRAVSLVVGPTHPSVRCCCCRLPAEIEMNGCCYNNPACLACVQKSLEEFGWQLVPIPDLPPPDINRRKAQVQLSGALDTLAVTVFVGPREPDTECDLCDNGADLEFRGSCYEDNLCLECVGESLAEIGWSLCLHPDGPPASPRTP